MDWFPDTDPDTAPRMLSNLGYWITYTPMARGHWYNAFTPDGLTIASGQLERCLEACERHHSTPRGRHRGAPLGTRGKRQFAPPSERERPYRRRASAAPPVAV